MSSQAATIMVRSSGKKLPATCLPQQLCLLIQRQLELASRVVLCSEDGKNGVLNLGDPHKIGDPPKLGFWVIIMGTLGHQNIRTPGLENYQTLVELGAGLQDKVCSLLASCYKLGVYVWGQGHCDVISRRLFIYSLWRCCSKSRGTGVGMLSWVAIAELQKCICAMLVNKWLQAWCQDKLTNCTVSWSP